jgi:hypothetical protein
MSIGSLGSSGEQFRDFLGGSQRDIGQGLQDVLSTYGNPSGNFNRLNDRSRGLFQLNNAEYQNVYDNDSQNSYAESWYQEYRAVLNLRAETLKKKLNRSYTQVLERSMYAPLRPNDKWVPEANRDMNDISASDPLQLPGTVVGDPVIPPNILIDDTLYAHTDWFGSTATKGSTGDPYQDIRRYLNSKYPLSDMDGDGEGWTWNDGSTQYESSDNSGPAQYYDLWAANAGGFGSPIPLGNYDITNNAYLTTNWFQKGVASEMNVPPSTSTNNFVLTDPAGDNYYAEIPTGMEANDLVGLLPASLLGAPADGYAIPASSVPGGSQIQTRVYGWKNTSSGVMQTSNTTGTPPGGAGPWVQYVMVTEGTRVYDPRGNVNQNLFTPSAPFNGPAGAINTGISINTQLAVPPPPPLLAGAPNNMAEADLVDGTAIPPYQKDFVDSWMEARAVQHREAQVEAGVSAYIDGSTALAASGNPQANSMSYAEMMDNVFSSLDSLGSGIGGISGGGTSPVGPPGGGGSVTFPPQVPSGGGALDLSSTMPYGHHIIPTPVGFSISGSVNTMYEHGREYGGVNTADTGSIYGIIYQRLAFAATDPFSGPTAASGSAGLSGSIAASTPPVPAPPPAGGVGQQGSVGGTNNLYTPIPVGAAENSDDAQPNINNAAGVGNLNDTMFEIPSQATSIDNISKLFVGRQWDYVPGVDGVGAGAVKYEADTISAHMMTLPGWYGGTADNTPGPSGPLLTMSPPIEGFALQSAASAANWGKIDDAINFALGGSFLRVGGGSDSSGFPDIDGSTTKYNVGVGFGMGTLGLFWGHTSAIGRVDDIEYLMTNPGPLFGLVKATLGVLSTVGGASPGDISVFPNVGLFGTNVDFNIPIPIPIPFVGLFWLNIPMTAYGGMSWDVMTDYMQQFLDSLKHEVLDSVSVYSYATSGGTAMDSYGMRGEYHFIEKGAFGTIENMPSIGPIDFGSAAQSVISSILGVSGSVNNADLEERLLKKRHSYEGGEARELETGGFFTTAAFLSQFNLNQMDYSYWTATSQNEEMANMDTMRMLLVSGKEIMSFLNMAVFAAAGQLNPADPLSTVTLTIINMLLQNLQESVNSALMWDLLLHDQNQSGFVTSMKIMSSHLQSEGYDFIEDERKIFQNDYQVSANKGVIGSAIDTLVGSFEVPNTILEGTANTRRYKPYLTGVDVRAGRQGWAQARAGEYDLNGDGRPDGGGAGQPLVNPLLRDPSQYDENWNIHDGFWQDTGLGDINEVYVRQNTVSWGTDINGEITGGLGNNTAANAVNVETRVDRYVGSGNRIVGRAYDGAAPVNLQQFRYGYFADKYFGSYIRDTQGALDNIETRTIIGLDSDTDGTATLYMHGGKGYYDRTKSYDMSFKFASSSSVISLSGKQALTPTLGGNIKMGTVDKNIDYQGRMGYDLTGQDNPLNAVLTDYLRVREDGSNAKLVREFRDVFNLDLLDDIYITSSANAPTGGGVTSSIRLKFHGYEPDTLSPSAVANLGLGTSFENQANNQVGGTGSLVVNPGYLGRKTYFKNSSRGMMDIFLNSFFAFKRPPKTK